MLHRDNRLTRLITAGLAIAAIAPAAAVAQPIDGQGQGAGGGAGLTQQDLRAPDQTGANGGTPYGRYSALYSLYGRASAPTAPQWPANPQPIGHAKPTAATQSSDDGGLDTGIWVAIGGAAAGLGLAGQKRLRSARQRQLA